MLKLHKIVKDYPAGDGPVRALSGIDLSFGKSEFVTVLGPSGCGKTTLLNIIGGLDQYSEGDLIIKGKSTKDFDDRDWDAYRNHSIGFVFQTYNLIPHQTVLQNVEIALTVSGVGKAERRQRAIRALNEVGLGDQLNKRPNQVSGGQMQRVAIARALVTDPDIILADEPTGALDTETSLQVMEILKEIAKDRLVIMVTHNPMLAERYSTRIIKMLDGKITDDSGPTAQVKAPTAAKQESKPARKPSMSFGTAFMLSLKNLFTKKGRTTLTAFAGSIGIMGIALILAVSQGMTQYINAVQEDALASYPLTIEKTSVDLTTLMETFMGVHNAKTEHELDAVYKKTAIYEMVSAFNDRTVNENDLESFKAYLETEYSAKPESNLNQAITGVQYSYDLDLLVYTKSIDGEIIKSDARALLNELMAEHMGIDMSAMSGGRPPAFGAMQSMPNFGMGMMGSSNLWQEMLTGKDGDPVNAVLKNQYDLVYGAWPNSYDQVVLVLDKNNELNDMTLYALGLEPKENVDALMDAALNGAEFTKKDSVWSYEEICAQEFRVILNPDCYILDEENDRYFDLRKTDAGLRYLYDDALVLKVTGVIRPNKHAQSTMLSGSIAYTNALTKYVVDQSQNSPVITAQKASATIDVFNGLPFKESSGELTAAEKESELREYIQLLDEKGKAAVYIGIMSIPPQEQVDAMVEQMLAGHTRPDIEATMTNALAENMGLDKEAVAAYIAAMSDDEINELFAASVAEQYKAQYAERIRGQLAPLSPAQLAAKLEQDLESYSTENWATYYDEIMVFSDSSYEANLSQMGYVDLDSPTAINIFASSFANKNQIEQTIADYNEGVPELSQIKYTDYLGIMMSSITTIINAITYVLLAFVAISLIVSSIMIGVITLISVQERTKEIGILRAIGASKGDVSSMFNAETVIIGFASGLLGIAVTYLLCIPINAILHRLTGIANLNAFLPVAPAAILILISIALSLVAGLIPSRSAAKKDPVVALRTE